MGRRGQSAPLLWHMHLDPHTGGCALAFSAYKAHQAGAMRCMLGRGSDEKQHEAAPDVRGTCHGGWEKSGTPEHWRVKTVSVTREWERWLSHWSLVSGTSIRRFVPKLERGQALLSSEARVTYSRDESL